MASNYLIDGDYTRPRPIGQRRVTLPFRTAGDYNSKIVEVDYKILPEFYLSNGFAKNDTPLPGAPGFFLVDQIEKGGAGFKEFTRFFANVPAERDEYEGYIFTPPSERTAFFQRNFFKDERVFTSPIPGHHISPSDSGWTVLPGTQIARREHTWIPVTAIAGDGVTEVVVSMTPVTRWYYSLDLNFVNNAYVDVASATQLMGRPFSITSRVNYKYYHTEDPDSIPRQQTQLQIVWPDTTGTADYAVAGEKCIEATIVTRWRGNIWQAKTRYWDGVEPGSTPEE